MGQRFLTPGEVAEELSLRPAQVYALLRTGDLPAVKIGGRGQWRVERARLEQWIEQLYETTQRFIAEHPFGVTADTASDGELSAAGEPA